MPLLLVLVSAALASQSPVDRANFTGSWKMIAARSDSPAQTPPVTEMMFVIEHGATHIRLDITSADAKPMSVSYPIVPTPKLPPDPVAGDERRAYWDGAGRLVVERGGTISGQTVSARQALSLNADGSEMTVERLVIVQHGYTLKGAKNYASAKDVFARVAP
ncbi:MAG TPA: hypothetical protein VFV51_18110 [Vicinamibacterales bacterium]|nr:hypothetical protein [Vicinamibacterales bacterium]